MSKAVWDLVHAERRALVADLATLPAEQWETPSLAKGWTVHDVAGHLVTNARTTPFGLVAAMVRAKGDFDRQTDAGVVAGRGDSPAQTLDRLRAVTDRRTGPPTWLAAVESRLVEEVAHGEDIRRAVGITRDYPVEAVTPAIRYQAKTKDSIGGRRSLAERVTLVTDDADLRLGDGPELRGTALALLMVLTGRTHALEDLHGPGATLLDP